MTAARTAPDPVSNPAGYDGGDLATLYRTEIEGLWDYVINQVQSIAGTANAIAGTCYVPLIGSYVSGMTFRFVPTLNNTTAVTVNFDGKGAKDLRQPDGTALIADDIVNGQPVVCWYDDFHDYFRMETFSQRAVAANTLAAVTSNLLWTLIGDTTVGAAVAQVEHTFVANTYSKLLVLLSGLSPASNTVNLSATLRNAGGAILTLVSSGFNGGSGTFAAADNIVAQLEFLIDIITAGGNKTHGATLKGAGKDTVGGSSLPLIDGSIAGASATAPDRVRIAFGSGNIDAGRVMTYGLVA